ncbi:hypothetical protein [Vogesella indigofera]|uniref:hypothetical protein n=1 Tax=Vogesella indigofera TaxID=45465 RepID=UPI0011C39BF9|nr:hypothetical protein [Vogesella indigofera]
MIKVGRKPFRVCGQPCFGLGIRYADVFICRFLRGGGLLSFASPKESNQRKGDPTAQEFP